jgi:hypothetical protein
MVLSIHEPQHRRRVHTLVLGLGALLLHACSRTVTPVVPTTPVPQATAPVVSAPTVRRVLLPTTIAETRWRISSMARLQLTPTGARNGGRAEEQSVESEGMVTWRLARQTNGALRGTGQIDGYIVRSSLDSGVRSTPATAASRAPLPLLLLDVLLDSVTARVTTRPLLTNECDRWEASAAALARELLVRIPDGLTVGDRWRDSTVSLVCRSTVPMTVHTVVRSTIETLDDERVIVRREISTRLDGKGGSAFRALELTGSGSELHRVELRLRDGTVTSLSGDGTITLQTRELTPPAPPKAFTVVQRITLRAERISR